MSAAQRERELASGGDFRVGSNIGKGQVKSGRLCARPGSDQQERARQRPGDQRTRRRPVPKVKDKHGIAAGLGGIDFKSKTADVALT